LLLSQPYAGDPQAFVAAHINSVVALGVLAVVAVAFTLGRSWARLTVAVAVSSAFVLWLVFADAGYKTWIGHHRLMKLAILLAAMAAGISYSGSAKAWFRR
jgi:hypothetical protein